MVTHSSILAWRIPWTEEPSGLQAHYKPSGHKELDRLSGSHTHTHTQKSSDSVDWEMWVGSGREGGSTGQVKGGLSCRHVSHLPLKCTSWLSCPFAPHTLLKTTSTLAT